MLAVIIYIYPLVNESSVFLGALPLTGCGCFVCAIAMGVTAVTADGRKRIHDEALRGGVTGSRIRGLYVGLRRRRMVSLAFAGLAFFIGFYSILRISSDVLWTGIPRERVIELTARAVSDARETSGGGSIVTVRLIGVCDHQGNQAEAAGSVVLFFRKPVAIPKGRIIGIGSASGVGSGIGSGTAAPLFPRPGGGTSAQGNGNGTAAENGGGPAAGNGVSPAAGLKQRFPPPAEFCFCDAGSLSFFGWTGEPGRIRALLSDRISGRIRRGGEWEGLLLALLLGVRDDLGVREFRRFQQAGCLHILALSGMHLGLFAGILLIFLLPVFGGKNAPLVAVIFLLPFIFLAGSGVSLLRAFFMYLLSGLCKAGGRKGDGRSILGAVFFIVILIDPSQAYSSSFQLSFGAIAGLLLFLKPVSSVFARFLPAPVGAAIAASIAAQMVTLPLTVRMFSVYYPVGIIASPVVTLQITVFIVMGLCWLAVDLLGIPILPALLRRSMDLVYSSIMSVTFAASRFPSVECGPSGVLVSTAGLFVLLMVIWLAERGRIRTRQVMGKGLVTDDRLGFTERIDGISEREEPLAQETVRPEFPDITRSA